MAVELIPVSYEAGLQEGEEILLLPFGSFMLPIEWLCYQYELSNYNPFKRKRNDGNLLFRMTYELLADYRVTRKIPAVYAFNFWDAKDKHWYGIQPGNDGYMKIDVYAKDKEVKRLCVSGLYGRDENGLYLNNLTSMSNDDLEFMVNKRMEDYLKTRITNFELKTYTPLVDTVMSEA